MGSTPKQPVGRRGIPNYIREELQEGKIEVGGSGLRLVDDGNFEDCYCFASSGLHLDALDEFLPGCLPELFESFQDIVRESTITRIFLTEGLTSGKIFKDISLGRS